MPQHHLVDMDNPRGREYGQQNNAKDNVCGRQTEREEKGRVRERARAIERENEKRREAKRRRRREEKEEKRRKNNSMILCLKKYCHIDVSVCYRYDNRASVPGIAQHITTQVGC